MNNQNCFKMTPHIPTIIRAFIHTFYLEEQELSGGFNAYDNCEDPDHARRQDAENTMPQNHVVIYMTTLKHPFKFN